MKALTAAAYRFSISWPRIFPQGTGSPNPKGLDFYNRLLDDLVASGIAPFPTLYHWDLPQALQDRGGWETRDTAKAFADYAGYVVEKLSDRARHFFTLNECAAFVELGHGTGVFAPGLKLPPGRLNQVRHHALLAHGLAVQAIRARSRAGTQTGPAENISVCVPVIETPEHIAYAQQNLAFICPRTPELDSDFRLTRRRGMKLRTSNPNQRHEEIVCALAIAHNVNSVHQTGKRRLGCPDVGGNL